MNQAQIYAHLNAIFDDVFDLDSTEITPETTAKDIEGWDSISHIRLIITVEKKFNIKLSASDVGRLETVGDLATLIQSRTE
ncbi:MAG: acyl carrier protein [Acidobacteria bacterium]|nr:acyl carrier protein [Acidobacteriota bacterium]